MINFVLRAASTLENTSEQRTVHKFSVNFTRRFISTVTLRSFHVPIPREFHSNFPDVLFPPQGGEGGRIGGISNILCAQCERSRFYMIYGILRNPANFNENPSMRARASEHSSKFCEQI